jgi:hypothetical protein
VGNGSKLRGSVSKVRGSVSKARRPYTHNIMERAKRVAYVTKLNGLNRLAGKRSEPYMSGGERSELNGLNRPAGRPPASEASRTCPEASGAS